MMNPFKIIPETVVKPGARRKKLFFHVSHGLILLMLMLAIAAVVLSDDSRRHFMGSTLIIHQDGRIALCLPTDRVCERNLFQYLDSGVVCMLSTIYISG